MAEIEPQSANDYSEFTTTAVKSVLLEIAQILGMFRGRFAVIGGIVPQLLLAESEMVHVGTMDVDLALDAEALGNGEYATLVETLQNRGYQQDPKRRRFQLVRTVKAQDSNPEIPVVVDFLMPRDAEIVKNSPVLVEDFAVQRADGVELALDFNEIVKLDGVMPSGGHNSATITVASIPALLVMKGYAIDKRDKPKDAYDIYFCIRNYPAGIDSLVADTLPILEIEAARTAFGNISEKFRSYDDYGPNCVRRFVQDSTILGQRTPSQWQQDAFGQIDAWLRGLGIR